MSLTRDVDKLAAFHRARRRREWWAEHKTTASAVVVSFIAVAAMIALQVWLP